MRSRFLSLIKKTTAGQRAVQQAILVRCIMRTRLARLNRRGEGVHTIIRNSRSRSPFGRLFKLSADGYPTFFGYYDKSPFDAQDHRILAMSMVTRRDDKAESNRLPVRLGYFEWAEIVAGRPEFHAFGESNTWSWQQGCMLQWLPAGAEGVAVYNRLVANRYGSVIQNVATRKVLREMPFPLYAVNSTGRQGVSLNFSRLERLRPGYGYGLLSDSTDGSAVPGDDGIWLHRIEDEDSQLLVSMGALAGFSPDPSMDGAIHYVNHLQFNPDGTKLVFLHLWMPAGPRRNRLMLFDLNQHTLHVLDDAATVSHFNWLSDSRLIMFRTPFLGKKGYYVCETDTRNRPRLEPLEGIGLGVDGHPSLAPTGDQILTDSYPDRFGEQGLYLYSIAEKKTVRLGSFYSPCRYRGFLRCDLHPRWNRAGDGICFDSCCEDRRAMYVVDKKCIIS